MMNDEEKKEERKRGSGEARKEKNFDCPECH